MGDRMDFAARNLSADLGRACADQAHPARTRGRRRAHARQSRPHPRHDRLRSRHDGAGPASRPPTRARPRLRHLPQRRGEREAAGRSTGAECRYRPASHARATREDVRSRRLSRARRRDGGRGAGARRPRQALIVGRRAWRAPALNGLQNVAAHVGKTTALLTFASSARVSSSPQKTRRELMKTISRAVALAAALGCANLACGIGARAQDYPTRPITMIVPFPAGGPTDTLGRIIGERMRVSLGQPIVIENVTGAGSTIGVTRAAQAAPDGYTLALGNWTSFVGSGALYRTSYDLLRDFE